MPRSEAVKRAQAKYQQEKQLVLAAKASKEEGLKIKAFAQSSGLSMSAFILASIREYMHNHPLPPEKSPQDASPPLPD